MKSLTLPAAVMAGLLATTSAQAQWMDLDKKARAATLARGASDGAQIAGELVVTRTRPSSFADAKAKAVQSLNDGEETWVAVKLNKPLSEYGLVTTHAGRPEYYEVQIDITPANERRAYKSCFWYLLPNEAASTELVLGLGPSSARSMPISGGDYTKDTKMGCWLATVGDDDAKAGVWKNRVAFVSMNPNNGTADKIIAASPLTANVPNGFPLWNRMKHQSDRCDVRKLAKSTAPIVCPK